MMVDSDSSDRPSSFAPQIDVEEECGISVKFGGDDEGRSLPLHHVFADVVNAETEPINGDLPGAGCVHSKRKLHAAIAEPLGNEAESSDDEHHDFGNHHDDYDEASVDGQDLDYPDHVAVAFRYLTQKKPPRSWCLAVVTNPWFERLSMCLIMVNCFTLGMYKPCEDHPVCNTPRCITLEIFDHAIFCFFTIEMIIKIIAMGLYGRKTYLDSPWNRLDMAVVIAGLLEYCVSPDRDINLSALRAVRVLRPLRAINRIPSLRILVTLLLDTLPMLGNVLLLCFFVFFIFGIMGVQLWQSVLRNRCMMNDTINAIASEEFGVKLPLLFQASYPDREFICSRSTDDGMQRCNEVPAYAELKTKRRCNLTIEQCRNSPHNCTSYVNRTSLANEWNTRYSNETGCVNWNRYYDTCAIGDKNPFLGAISFDNIGFAWVAIFQVISLEAWVDILYAIQDAFSYWSFIYFVALIVIGSFFMINLCLVVIATQFSDTKKRETERMRQERMLALSSSTLTIFSESHGLYREMVKLTVHLLRKIRRNTKRFCRDLRNSDAYSRFRLRIWPCFDKHDEHNHCRNHSHKRSSLSVVSNSDQTRPERSSASRNERSSSFAQCCQCHYRRTQAAQPYASFRTQSSQLAKSNIEIRITSERNSDARDGDENLQIRLVVPSQTPPEKEKAGNEECSKIHFNDVPEYHVVSSTDLSPTAPQAASEFSDIDPFNSPRRRSASECSSRIRVSPSTQHSPTCSAGFFDSAASPSPRPSSQCSCRRSCVSSPSDHVASRSHSHCSCYESRRHGSFVCSHRHSARSSRMRRSYAYYKKSHSSARRTWKRFRARLKETITHRYVQRAILVCILLNTLSMGIEHHNQPQILTDVLEYSNLFFTTLFAIEMILKLIAYGVLGYVSNIFNVWDSIIVMLSVIELAQGGASGLSVLRTFRLLRILKLVRFMPALRRQLVVMLRTMDNVTTFLVLLALFMFIFSILGMNLFGCQFCEIDRNGVRKCDRKNFDSLLWASITVFQVLTQEDWNAVLYLGMSKTTAWASLYFIALMTFGNYVLFNLLVAILVEGFATDDHVSIASRRSIDKTSKSSPSKSSKNTQQNIKSPAHCSEAHASVLSGASRASRYSNYSESTCHNGHVAQRGNHSNHNHYSRHNHCQCHCHQLQHCHNHHPQVEHHDLSGRQSQSQGTAAQPSRNSGDDQLVPPIITTTHATPTQSPNRPRAATGLANSPAESATGEQQFSTSFIDLLRNQSLNPTLPYDPDSISFLSIDRSNLTLNETTSGAGGSGSSNAAVVVHVMNGHLANATEKKKKLPRFDSKVLRHGSLKECESDYADAEKEIDNNLLHPQMCLHASIRVKRSPSPARRFPLLSVPSSVLDCHVPRGASESVTSCPQDLLMDRVCHTHPHSHSSTDSSLHSVFANALQPNLASEQSREAENDTDERLDDDDCSSIDDETTDEELSDDDLERKVYKEVERAIQEQEQIENDPAAVGEIAFDVQKFIPEPRGCFKTRHEYSLYIFAPSNRLRLFCLSIVESRWFEIAVLGFIVLNCIALACERPFHNEQVWERDVLNIANYMFTVVFAVEMLMKVLATNFIIGEKAYMSSGWNRMDGILVIISVFDVVVSMSSISSGHRIFQILRVFRLLRTLRPLRVINRAPGLKLVVQTLLSSLRPIGNIVLICCAFFIIFGILGVQLFKGKFYYCDGQNLINVTCRLDCERSGLRWVNHQYNFDNLGQALMTLFVLASKDGWVQIMYQGLDAVGEDLQPIENYGEWRLVYFISFLLIVGFFVISMFVGVIVDNFNRARYLQMTEEKTRRLKNRIIKLRRRLEQGRQLPFWHSYPSWRLATYKLINNKYFDLAISAIIGINVITMALEFYLMPDILKITLEILNYCFTAMFVIEGALKIVALGFMRYMRDRWNQLDLFIIVLSVIGIFLEDVDIDVFRVNPTLIRVFRVMRIARVLKLLKMAKGIRELLDTVVQALPQVGNLGLLFFLLFFIFAALGVELFGSLECSDDRPCVGMDKHANFQNFANAFLTLFRIATGDNWNGIMKDTLRHDCNTEPDCVKNCCVSSIAAPLFFVVFVLIAQFVLVNVVIAVLMRHLEDAHRSIDDFDLASDSTLPADLRSELQSILNELHSMNINMRRRKSCIFPSLPRVAPIDSNRGAKGKIKEEVVREEEAVNFQEPAESYAYTRRKSALTFT